MTDMGGSLSSEANMKGARLMSVLSLYLGPLSLALALGIHHWPLRDLDSAFRPFFEFLFYLCLALGGTMSLFGIIQAARAAIGSILKK